MVIWAWLRNCRTNQSSHVIETHLNVFVSATDKFPCSKPLDSFFPTKTHNRLGISVSGFVQANSVLTESFWKVYLKRQQSSDNGKVLSHHDTYDLSRISPVVW